MEIKEKKDRQISIIKVYLMSVPKIVEITYAVYEGLFKIQLCKEYVGRIVNNGPELKFRGNFAFVCSPSLFPGVITWLETTIQ